MTSLQGQGGVGWEIHAVPKLPEDLSSRGSQQELVALPSLPPPSTPIQGQLQEEQSDTYPSRDSASVGTGYLMGPGYI